MIGDHRWKRSGGGGALLLGAVVSLALGVSNGAEAAGYGLKEHSAAALGNAFAGATAGAEDVTYAVFNPAALARQSGHQASAVATYVRPSADLVDATSGGGGPERAEDVASSVLLPALYAMYSFDDRLKLGLSITAPWGLETSYDEGWAGRYYALDTRLETLTVTPMVAHKVNESLQLGGGILLQRAEGRLSNAIPVGNAGMVKGDDWGYGFQLGALYEPVEGTRLGLAYRSKIDHKLEGGAYFEGLPGPDSFSAKITTPEVVSFGLHQTVSPRWAVMAEAQWTRWSRFDELVVDFDDNSLLPDDPTVQNWKNSWFGALGVTFRPNDVWTLRAGVAYDQTPTRGETRSPRIPDADRRWLSLGLGYRPVEWLSLDLGYSHFWMKDAGIDQSSDQAGNAFRGDFSARAESSADIVSLQVTARF